MRTEKIGLEALVPNITDNKRDCEITRQTARHIHQEYKLFNRQRRKLWAVKRRKTPGGVSTHEEILTIPRYASTAADFMKSTGLIAQFQARDME